MTSTLKDWGHLFWGIEFHTYLKYVAQIFYLLIESPAFLSFTMDNLWPLTGNRTLGFKYNL